MRYFNNSLKVLLFWGATFTSLIVIFYINSQNSSVFPYDLRDTGKIRCQPCISTQELIRRQNILGLAAAPFIPPTKMVGLLNLISCCLIGIFYHRHRNNFPPQTISGLRILFHVIMSNLMFWTPTIILSLLAMHVFHPSFGSVIISHIYNDCVKGPILVIVPVFTLLILAWSKDDSKNYGVLSFGTVFFLLLCSEVFLYPQNFVTIVGLLTSSTITASLLLEEGSTIFKKVQTTFNIFRGNSLWMLCTVIILLISRELSLNHSRNLVEKNFHISPKISIGILSIARPDNPRYLLTTLDSIISQLPHPRVDKNIKIFSFSFTLPGIPDVIFDSTKELMTANSVSNAYIFPVNGTQAIEQFSEDILHGKNENYTDFQTIMGQGNNRLKLHVATALHYMNRVANDTETDWLMIHEDDFPMCPNKWKWFSHVLNQMGSSPYCGAFVGTGGAGVVMARKVIPQVIESLLDTQLGNLASDQIMQDCLRGRLRNCAICNKSGEKVAAGLVISSHLIFGHIGFTSSMGHNYREEEARWPCGWTHPFNGDADVDVRHVDDYS